MVVLEAAMAAAVAAAIEELSRPELLCGRIVKSPRGDHVGTMESLGRRHINSSLLYECSRDHDRISSR